MKVNGSTQCISPRMLSMQTEKPGVVAIAALSAVIVTFPIALGGTIEWARAAFVLAVALIALGCALSIVRHGLPHNPALRPALWLALPLLAAQALVGAQLLFGWSGDVGASYRSLLLGLAYTLLFLLTVLIFNSRGRLTLLIGVLVASGTLQAFYGASVALSGGEFDLLGNRHGSGRVTGTYTGPNTLAAYLLITLSLGIGLLLALRNPQPWSLRGVLELLTGPRVGLRLGLIVMVIGLVMTASRSGNLAFGASLLLVGAVFVLRVREHRLRNLLLLLSIVVIDVLILSQYFGLDRLRDRVLDLDIRVERVELAAPGSLLTTADPDGALSIADVSPATGVGTRTTLRIDQTRETMAAAALQLSGEHRWTGYGADALRSGIQQHWPLMSEWYVDHAHNDYLQFLAEYGLPATLALAGFLLAIGAIALRALLQVESRFRSGLGFGVVMALLALGIHALSDFRCSARRWPPR
jgi:O-antigen ligase